MPILQANCQNCHRPGEVAPMSLITYEQARPFARAIKNAIQTKKMPPWFADPAFGHFSNERRLSGRDIETITAWVESIGSDAIDPAAFDAAEIGRNPFFCPDAAAAKRWEKIVDDARLAGSSVGAVVECVASGVPAGWGAC